MSPFASTALVASREISTRVRARSFIISSAILLAVIVLATFAPKIFESFGSTTTVATSGSAAQSVAAGLGTDYEASEASDADAARTSVENGDVDLAIISDDSVSGAALPSFTVVTQGDLGLTQEMLITQAVQGYAQAALLAQQGVDVAQLQAQVQETTPTIESVSGTDVDPIRLITAFVVSILLFMQIMTYGTTVATSVVEEKQSRIIEILLATVSARTLLIGKVIGVGLIGLGQLAVFLAGGAIGAAINDLLPDTSNIWGLATIGILWFIPTYLFYAFAYAAAGSMVSRQEEIGSTTGPMMLLVMASYMASVFALQDVTAEWVRIVSIIPPFSGLVMPLRVAAGIATPGEAWLAAGLLVLSTVVVALVASRIYYRSVLLTGARVKLTQALRG